MNNEQAIKETSLRIVVRVSQREFLIIEGEAQKLSKSRPKVLKDCFFERPPTNILMDAEMFGKFMSAFNRVGGNINQLARKANSGDIVLDKEFSSTKEEMFQILKFIVRCNGIRQSNVG